MIKIDATREAKRIIEAKQYRNVTGTAIGYKVINGKRTRHLGVIVYVRQKVSEKLLRPTDVIPKKVGDIPTDVVRAEFKALNLEPPLIDFEGPVKAGYSCGHPDITAGSVGTFANRKGKKCLVTNAHVGANTNDGEMGDPLYYPGPYDGGKPENIISHLVATIPIQMIDSLCPIAKAYVNFGNSMSKFFKRKSRIPSPVRDVTNQVDCCVHELVDGVKIDENAPNIGKPTGVSEAVLGMKVRKTGRTSGYTEGEVTGIEAMVQVSYGVQGVAIFENQIISDIPSAGGDSGSAVFENSKLSNLVGLLFAGGEGVTVMNRMQTVFDELGLDKID